MNIELKEILKSITQHKLRNVLTGFGIAWGIFILMLMMGFGDSFQKGIFTMFKGFAENTIVVWGSETTLPHNGTLEKKNILFDEHFINQSGKKFSEIKYISIEANSPQTMSISYEENQSNGNLLGVQLDFFKIKKQKVKSGRLLNYNDYISEKAVCIIPEDMGKTLFKKKNKIIGEYINIGGNFFKVIGVLKQAGMFDFGDRNAIIIPYTNFKSLYNSNSSRKILLALHGTANSKNFISDFKKHLAQYFNYNPDDERSIFLYSMSEDVESFQSLFSGIKVFIWFIGFCILLTGIISVGNIMYVNINERTREIGIRKAVGATPRNILDMILIESVVLTSIAGLVGMFSGYLVIQLIKLGIKSMADDNMFLANVGINAPIVIGSFIMLIISGVIAGILPAIKASKIKPVIALNQEN